MTSAPLAARLGRPGGPLFFPVTAFGPDGTVDLDTYRSHVRRGIDAGAAAVFACCGTGEFHALTPEEFEACVRAAVEVTEGRVPVVAGTGYGTALAVRYARLAEAAGADGLLAMPPYLVVAGQEGLLRHYREIAAATALPVIVYQRDNAVFTPETVLALARTEGIVGLKDGLGDLGLMQRIVSAVRTGGPDAFLYFNGLPTAELTQPAYRAVGVPLYSSAVFCFAPRHRPRLLRRAGERRPGRRRPAPRRLLPAVRRTPRPGPRLRRLPRQGGRTARRTGRRQGQAAAARTGRGPRQAARAPRRAGAGPAGGGRPVKASAFVYLWDVNGDPDAPRPYRRSRRTAGHPRRRLPLHARADPPSPAPPRRHRRIRRRPLPARTALGGPRPASPPRR
ncbi:hypothetical protein GCM10020256_60260 [Streptomyces thermocoprophilus]